jgi:probable blue pigment (indigoidine) exporter
MKINQTYIDILLTALAPIVWGSTYVVTTELLPPDSPLWASVIRALPAGLILLLIYRKLPQGIWWFRAAVLGVLNIGAFFYFLFVAAYLLPGGVAALVMSCQPMIVLLLGAVLLRQPIRMLQIFACVIGGMGVALLVIQPSAQLSTAGVVAGLLGAMSMAAGVVLTKRWGCPEGVSILTFTGWQLTVGGLSLLPIALMTESLPGTITPSNLAGFVYLCLVGALLAYAIWFRGISRLPAVTVSFLSLVSPLAAATLGFIILHESFTVVQLLGAVGIITAVILAQLRNVWVWSLKPSAHTSS